MPTTAKPEKYSWLGGEFLPTELPSGVVAMGARSYVPKIGRFLQPDPVPGGTDNPYAYTDGNPVNETDVTGEFVEGAYLYAFNSEENIRSTEREAAREQAAREEAERKAAEAAAIAAMDAKIAAEEAAVPQWVREYAMGGPSLLEMMAAKGEVPGGGMAEGGPSAAEMAEVTGCTGSHACASSIFGSVVHWVSNNAHKLVAAGIGAVSSLVVGAVTLVAVTACGATAALTEDAFVAYDCYKIGSFGFSLSLAGAASAYEAWKVEKK